MIIREAQTSDIQQLHAVRISVTENTLSSPELISANDYEEFLTLRGKGWLCEIDNVVAGFAIVDIREHNIWALFVLPEYEGKGIGKKLHDIMLNWYFSQTKEKV